MSEEAAAQAASPEPGADAGPEIHSYRDVLRSLKGKVVTVANPESLEDTPMGYQLTTGFYRAKVVTVRDDFMSVACELVRKGREAKKERVRQFIPVERIKRVSIATGEIILHL